MAGIRIEGNTSGNVAEVNASNQLKIIPETDAATNPANVGAVRIFSEVDSGVKTGVGYLLSPEVSDDYRWRVGLDVILDNETFNYVNQNTAKFKYLSTTLTMAQSANALVTNATGITTINTAAAFRTWQHFPILGQQSPLYVEITAALSAALTTNTTIDFGLFLQSDASPYAPSDGVYFRFNSAGLIGLVNNNGEVTTGVFAFTPTINQVYQFLIAVNEREVEFWIDDVLYATIETQVGKGQPFQSSALPFQVRHAIGGTAAGAALSFKITDYSVQLGDLGANYPISQLATRAGGGLQVQQGATTGGQLSTYALGAAPAAVTLTASTAPATNTLGGLFLLPVAITAGESDYPLFAWQNPAGTAAIPGKMFFCTGIIVQEAFVTTALTGGPIVLAYAVGFGSTAASLATTETTTFTSNTTKIARKYPLGAQALAATAAIGALATGFQRSFSDAPIAVNPGEFLHIILRAHGTSTSAGAIRGGVTILGYFM